MKFFNILFVVFLLSCEKNVVHAPSKQEHDTFLQNSREKEKERQKQEYSQLENWVSVHPQFKLQLNEYGYWIGISSDKETPVIDDLDFVQFTKQYQDLNKNIIYTFQQNGLQNIILGKTSEIRGIETALRSLSEGDRATLLLPSFMAYGLYGDENKIGANTPILVELEVLKVKKN